MGLEGTPSYGFKVPFWNNELLWKSFETPWVFIGEVFTTAPRDNMCETECVRACVWACASASANQSSSLCTKIQMWRAQSFCCLWRLFTRCFFNWIMLVLWLLPFKHRCEEPLVHFVRNLLLMINKILSDCNPAGVTRQMPYECHLCAIASLSLVF